MKLHTFNPVNPFGFGAIGTDIYKLCHAGMYQKGTDMVYGNLTPRSNRLFKAPVGYDGKMVVLGTHASVQELHMNWERFFKMGKADALAIYMDIVNAALGEGVVSVDNMAELHDLGYLPIRVKSLKEGSRVSMKVPVLTIKNTIGKFYWIVNFLETAISQITWPTMTTATIAAEYRRILTKWARLTGTPEEFIDWQAHDFSSRGLMGPEAAARIGVGHLASFYGTDNIQAAYYAKAMYDVSSVALLFGSVPATEHAVSSSNILYIEKMLEKGIMPTGAAEEIHQRGMEAGLNTKEMAELLFLHRYITVLFPTGIASYVTDTYDYWAVLTKILPLLKDEIMARDGKLVIRPDSGDPRKIIAGLKAVSGEDGKAVDFSSVDHFYQMADGGFVQEDGMECVKINGTFYALKRSDLDGCSYVDEETVIPYHEAAGSIRVLYQLFGGTITETGHKLLDSHIGLIYGDSITLERSDNILEHLFAKGFASGNVVFGVGSFTYQYITRDTFGFAVKATATSVDGEFIAIFKDPATGDKLKKSAKGYMLVVKDRDGEFVMVDEVTEYEEQFGELDIIYEDGMFALKPCFNEIRRLIKEAL